jgi:hypothetical protein
MDTPVILNPNKIPGQVVTAGSAHPNPGATLEIAWSVGFLDEKVKECPRTLFPCSIPKGRLNFRLVQISFFHDAMETVQLKSSSSAEWARSLSKQPTQSRRDGTIKSPARKCRVRITNGSSPGRDGTERHSSPSGSSPFDLDPQPDFPHQGRGRSSSNKINPTESSIPLIWTALAEPSPGR